VFNCMNVMYIYIYICMCVCVCVCVYSPTQHIIYNIYLLLATGFGHTDHHQSNIHKLKILSTLKMINLHILESYSVLLWDPIYKICYLGPYKHSSS
jgi:hypothetical protein